MPRRTPQKETGGAGRKRRSLPPTDASAIAVLRVALDVPQNEVAGDLGVSPGIVSDLEAGRRALHSARKDEILDVLSLPPEALGEAEAFVLSIRAKAQADGRSRSGEEAARRRVEGTIEKVMAAAGSFARTLIDGVDLEESRWEAERLWEELERLAPERRPSRIRSGPRFQKWALCELVCQKSLDAAGDSAAKAVEHASLAVLIADLVPGLPEWKRRLQGYARAHLANAWRVHGKLPVAGKEFAQAKALWESGMDERRVLNEAIVIGLEASLHLAQGHLDQALGLLDEALSRDSGTLKHHFLINRAKVLQGMQEFQKSIAALEELAPLLSREREPRLFNALRLLLADNFLHLGQLEDAVALLPLLRMEVFRLGNELDQLRLRWLQGRIAARTGQREEAFATLLQVRDAFTARGMPFDAVLATLELTTLLLEQGRHREVIRLTRELEQIFRSQGTHEKALEAVLLFRSAAERETITLDMVRRLSNYIECARHNSDLVFEG